MRNLSMMGSSKYEYEPWKFDEDVRRKKELRENKEKTITKVLEEFITQDTWQQCNFRIIIKVLRSLKNKYDL